MSPLHGLGLRYDQFLCNTEAPSCLSRGRGLCCGRLSAAMDIAGWLRGLGLEQYTQLFRDNDLDGEILCGMTAEDLKELGISSFGHRRRLLDAIAALRTAVLSEPSTGTSARYRSSEAYSR